MTRNAEPASSDVDQLKQFVAKFEPSVESTIWQVRGWLQHRFPSAVELVYDNYNFFVIGYSPTPRPSDSILSIAANAAGVGLCFIQGAKLPDPTGRLLGSGKQTRFIRIPSVEILTDPVVDALIDAAEDHSAVPFPENSEGRLIIRSVSAKQRPRRKN
jgi:hypothetical protein